ncbi:MAG TPA: beta-ketoacyl synthase N-terminal-like domain-containing protein [Ktedonobacteraceae bacterium]|nr:beta-ketoacyl synthase N-terminal-like domain-containing protein [Ktedonobacteraceae bacterium]
MEHHTTRRVVVTGLGVIAPNSIGKQAFWQATSNGISGIKRFQRFSDADLSIQVGGEVSNFAPEDYIEHKLADRTDRMTHFALVSAQEALQDAAIEMTREDPYRVGAVIANTFGGTEYAVEQVNNLYTRGPRTMSAFTSIAWLPVANVGQVSIRYNIRGYSKVTLNNTVGGLDALGLAYMAIRRGEADVIIAGGAEAPLQPYMLLVLSHSNFCARGDDPQAYRPFDRRAAGFLLAEGAGMCILEEYEHAQRRGASIYAEIAGFGQTNDPHALEQAPTSSRQYARALSLAMRDAQLSPHEIGYFSLDGRALPIFDASEAEALHSVFGSEIANIALSVPRTMLGHSFAAAGALDTITAILVLQHGIVPPTINCEELDPSYGLDLVRDEPRTLTGTAALVGGRSLTGVNVVLALKRL